MSATTQRRPAHLTLVKLLIVVILLAVATAFLVRSMRQAKEREQLAPITVALDNFDADAVWTLCKANPELVHTKGGGFDGMPLHLAATRGNKEMAQWLLNHNVDVDAKDHNGWTPLHWAAHKSRKDIASLLLANGADVNAKDENGWTPLHFAARNPYIFITELLLRNGANINVKDGNGYTPLQRAIVDGNENIAAFLRKHGATEPESAPVAPAAEK